MSDTDCAAAQARLLDIGMDTFCALRDSFVETRSALCDLAAVVDETHKHRISALVKQLDQYSTTVTLMGQVKSGKTTLANVLAGSPGLLPSDVNPWTSVVTTLHLNRKHNDKVRARFKFFDREDWDRLVVGGGRIGELAMRAGAESEMEEIKSQIEALQAKTKKRLGRNFDLLLGQQHKFDTFDSALLERYVCLGEHEPEDEEENKQGRFADMISSAELSLEVPQYAPFPSLCAIRRGSTIPSSSGNRFPSGAYAAPKSVSW